MKVTAPHVLLKQIRTERNLSVRQAASEVGISHSRWLAWESGEDSPSPVYRDPIQLWSGGKIRSDSWPATRQERRVAELRRNTLAKVAKVAKK